jgi:ribosomal protein S19
METHNSNNVLRKAALAVAIIGAIASLIFVVYAGHNNKSIILRLLFVGWVLSPFAALMAAHKIRERWTINARVILYWLTLVIAIASPVIYNGILFSPGVKLTPYFLFVPLFAWVVIIVFMLAAVKSRR